METSEKLREAREKGKIHNLNEEYWSLHAEGENLKRRRDDYENELAEKRAPTELELLQDRLEGILYSIGTFFLLGGVVFLVALSFRVFLPQTEFSIWLQTIVAVIFALGIIVVFHFLVGSSTRSAPVIPRWVIWFAAGGIIAGLILLATIRGLWVGSIGQFVETLRTLEAWARWLGIIGFIFIGFGLEIIEGIVGAFAWAKLTAALPPLKWYRKRRETIEEINRIEARMAEIEQILQPTPVKRPAAEKLTILKGKPDSDEDKEVLK